MTAAWPVYRKLRHFEAFYKGAGGTYCFSTLIQKQINIRKTKIKQLKTTPPKKNKEKTNKKSNKHMKNKDSKRDLTKNITQKKCIPWIFCFLLILCGTCWVWAILGRVSENDFSSFALYIYIYIFFLWLLDMCFTFNLCFLFSQAFLWVIVVLTPNKTQINANQTWSEHQTNQILTSTEPEMNWNDSEMYSQWIWWYHSDNTAITILAYSGLVHYIRKKKNTSHSLTGVKSTMQMSNTIDTLQLTYKSNSSWTTEPQKWYNCDT